MRKRHSLKTSLWCLLVLVSAVVATQPLAGHHGRGQSFDMEKRVTLEGVVSRVQWRNPHVLVFIDVKDATGTTVTWAFENSNVHTLARQGYNRNTLKVGQPVTAIVNPAVNGAPLGIIVKVILADGSEIMSRERGNPLD
jgi:hypothetical protein